MKLTEHIAQHVIDIHEGDNWTEVNIKNTLADVSVKEAVRVTDLSANSIAALLHHITFYTNIVHQRLMGTNPSIGEPNGFDVPALANEDDWERLKEENLKAARELATAIKQSPEERLFEPILEGGSTTYKTLHGVIEHAHYHLGQMVLIKRMVRKSSIH